MQIHWKTHLQEKVLSLYGLMLFIKKFSISEGLIHASLVFKKGTSKVEYTVNKDIVYLLPSVAFIDDSRNFLEEETGRLERSQQIFLIPY